MRIVAVTATPPHPPRSGYQIRCWQLLKQLAARHEVVLLTLEQGDENAAEWERTFTRVRRIDGGRTGVMSLARSLFSSVPHHVLTHARPALGRALAEESRGADALYLHYLYFAPLLPGRESSGGPAFVLDQHNLDHETWEGYAQLSSWAWQRAFFARQARLMRRFEAAHLRRFDLVLSVSEQDAASTRELAGRDATRVAVAPNGVDLARFGAARALTDVSRNVVFPGTDARRNVEGLSWFLRSCWSLVRASVPDARLVVAGRFDPRALPRNLRATHGLAFTGEVREMGEALAGASVAIVPVRFGGGTKIKALEAMAASLPVVLTVESARGLGVSHDENALVSADATAYAADVIALLRDPFRCRRIGEAARRFVEERHGWDRVVAMVEREITEAVARRCR